ncbi:unnamed protein product [Paramecium octaurelia]|uniref:Uncharacterized protein n=1 Tax=Paramecium octaurelia TaxID=43137 RepID=A0A8S1Y9Q7_PAROT|nr:unnamed protein product [Paramecium octaurelia]
MIDPREQKQNRTLGNENEYEVQADDFCQCKGKTDNGLSGYLIKEFSQNFDQILVGVSWRLQNSIKAIN